MNNLIKPNDISIVFSGHNTEEYVLSAIKSFLLFYPEYKDSIIYFDDDSTDNSVKEVEKLGVKVITWTEEYRQKASEINKTLKSIYGNTLEKVFVTYVSLRVCCIYHCIMAQLNTKYMLLLDGDIVILKQGLLEDFSEKILEGCRYVGIEDLTEISDLDNEYQGNYYKDYVFNLEDGRLVNHRISTFCCLFDIEYLKSINATIDRLDERNIIACTGGLVDVGTDFYYFLKENNIPIYEFKYTKNNMPLYHFSFASGMTKEKIESNSWCFFHYGRNLLQEKAKHEENKNLMNVFKQISTSEYPLNPSILLRSTLKKRYKSKIITD